MNAEHETNPVSMRLRVVMLTLVWVFPGATLPACSSECPQSTVRKGDHCVIVRNQGAQAGDGDYAGTGAGTDTNKVASSGTAGGMTASSNSAGRAANLTSGAAGFASAAAGQMPWSATSGGMTALSMGSAGAPLVSPVAGTAATMPESGRSASGAVATECSAGQMSCDDKTIRQCTADGAWSTGAPCPFVCKDGVCSGECVPASVQCEGNVPHTCDNEGHWSPGMPCPSVCSEGACMGTCVPNSKQCSANSTQVCDASGAWTAGETCPFVCDKGTCTGECRPNETRCSELVPETCDAKGKWQPGSKCPYLCDAGRCTGSCMPNDKRCMGAAEQTCSSTGAWSTGVVRANVCGAKCDPGSSEMCLDSGACVPGMRTCANGQWGPCMGSKRCTGGQVCSPDSAKCVECMNGQTRDCGKSNTLPCRFGKQSCRNDRWETTCTGEVPPAPVDTCNSLDDDCNGRTDDGCGANQSCMDFNNQRICAETPPVGRYNNKCKGCVKQGSNLQCTSCDGSGPTSLSLPCNGLIAACGGKLYCHPTITELMADLSGMACSNITFDDCKASALCLPIEGAQPMPSSLDLLGCRKVLNCAGRLTCNSC